MNTLRLTKIGVLINTIFFFLFFPVSVSMSQLVHEPAGGDASRTEKTPLNAKTSELFGDSKKADSLTTGALHDHVAKVFNVEGNVKILKKGEENWKPAQKEMLIENGDQILTAAGGFIEVVYDRFFLNIARIEEKTKAEFRSIEPTDLHLEDGTIFSALDGLAGEKYQISTPTAVAGVRGTHMDVSVVGGALEHVAVTADQKPEVSHAEVVMDGRVFDVPETDMLTFAGDQPQILDNIDPNIIGRTQEVIADLGAFDAIRQEGTAQIESSENPQDQTDSTNTGGEENKEASDDNDKPKGPGGNDGGDSGGGDSGLGGGKGELGEGGSGDTGTVHTSTEAEQPPSEGQSPIEGESSATLLQGGASEGDGNSLPLSPPLEGNTSGQPESPAPQIESDVIADFLIPPADFTDVTEGTQTGSGERTQPIKGETEEGTAEGEQGTSEGTPQETGVGDQETNSQGGKQPAFDFNQAMSFFSIGGLGSDPFQASDSAAQPGPVFNFADFFDHMGAEFGLPQEFSTKMAEGMDHMMEMMSRQEADFPMMAGGPTEGGFSPGSTFTPEMMSMFSGDGFTTPFGGGEGYAGGFGDFAGGTFDPTAFAAFSAMDPAIFQGLTQDISQSFINTLPPEIQQAANDLIMRLNEFFGVAQASQVDGNGGWFDFTFYADINRDAIAEHIHFRGINSGGAYYAQTVQVIGDPDGSGGAPHDDNAPLYTEPIIPVTV